MPLRTHARVAVAAAALLVALALPAAARAGSSITIGHGFKPGVAVDAAGTAYIAWYEDEAARPRCASAASRAAQSRARSRGRSRRPTLRSRARS